MSARSYLIVERGVESMSGVSVGGSVVRVGGISTAPMITKVGSGYGCCTSVAVAVGAFTGSFVHVGEIVVCVGQGCGVIVGALVMMILVSRV
jgi:hypothetical protein